jgi:hypothetical protein
VVKQEEDGDDDDDDDETIDLETRRAAATRRIRGPSTAANLRIRAPVSIVDTAIDAAAHAFADGLADSTLREAILARCSSVSDRDQARLDDLLDYKVYQVVDMHAIDSALAANTTPEGWRAVALYALAKLKAVVDAESLGMGDVAADIAYAPGYDKLLESARSVLRSRLDRDPSLATGDDDDGGRAPLLLDQVDTCSIAAGMYRDAQDALARERQLRTEDAERALGQVSAAREEAARHHGRAEGLEFEIARAEERIANLEAALEAEKRLADDSVALTAKLNQHGAQAAEERSTSSSAAASQRLAEMVKRLGEALAAKDAMAAKLEQEAALHARGLAELARIRDDLAASEERAAAASERAAVAAREAGERVAKIDAEARRLEDARAVAESARSAALAAARRAADEEASARAELEAAKRRLGADAEEARRRAVELDRELSEERAAAAAATASMRKSADERVAAAEAELERLRLRASDLEAKLRSAESAAARSVERLEARVAASEARIAGAERDLAAAERRLADANAFGESAAAERDGAVARAAEARSRIEALSASAAALEAELRDAKAARDACGDDLRAKISALGQCEIASSEIRSEANAAELAAKGLRAEIAQLAAAKEAELSARKRSEAEAADAKVAQNERLAAVRAELDKAVATRDEQMRVLEELMGLAKASTFKDLVERFKDQIKQLDAVNEAVAVMPGGVLCKPSVDAYKKLVASGVQVARALAASISSLEAQATAAGDPGAGRAFKTDARSAAIAAALPEMREVQGKLVDAYKRIYAESLGSDREPSDEEVDGKSPKSCALIGNGILKRYTQRSSEITELTAKLSDLVDRFSGGRVRVYVRIRPRTSVAPPRASGSAAAAVLTVKPIDGMPRKVSVTLSGAKSTDVPDIGATFGPFFSAFSDEFSKNAPVFYGSLDPDPDEPGAFKRSALGVGGPDGTPAGVQGMYTLASTLVAGGTTVLFGYGLSGAGKTYTLFGSGASGQADAEPGIVQMVVGEIERSGAAECRLESIYELYGYVETENTTKAANWETISLRTEVHKLYSASDASVCVFPAALAAYENITNGCDDEQKTVVEDEQKGFMAELAAATIAKGAEAPSSSGNLLRLYGIRAIVSAADEHRKKQVRKRIKTTVLNDASSRSHLVVTVRVARKPPLPASRLVVMDLAGKEDPVVYAMRMFKAKPDRKAPGDNLKYVLKKDTPASAVQQRIAIVAKRELGKYALGDEVVPKDERSPMAIRFADYRPPETGYKFAVEILAEGVFINETLNQLAYFLSKEESGETAAAAKEFELMQLGKPDEELNSIIGATDRVFVYDPKKAVDDYKFELTAISTNKLLMRPRRTTARRDNKKMGATFMLQLLHSLKTAKLDENCETKFVMLCCARQDATDAAGKYSETLVHDTVESLRFAQSISSRE